ncbi:unnamed protein product [Orchesella dallaii]|uniref:Uncharacterized protein n=1 Tax=Orchesella dallaii TaxID=48710 RepID=A0ABP1PYT0_9HEXA
MGPQRKLFDNWRSTLFLVYCEISKFFIMDQNQHNLTNGTEFTQGGENRRVLESTILSADPTAVELRFKEPSWFEIWFGTRPNGEAGSSRLERADLAVEGASGLEDQNQGSHANMTMDKSNDNVVEEPLPDEIDFSPCLDEACAANAPTTEDLFEIPMEDLVPRVPILFEYIEQGDFQSLDEAVDISMVIYDNPPPQPREPEEQASCGNLRRNQKRKHD